MGEHGVVQAMPSDRVDLRRDLLTLTPTQPTLRPLPPLVLRRAHRRCDGSSTNHPALHLDLRQDLLVLAPAGPAARPLPPMTLRRAPRCDRPRPVVPGVLRTASERRDPGPAYRLVKAFFDRLDAAILLLVTSPLLIAAMIAVKVTSPGPVFFRQERLGQGGRRFTMLKLRTMVCDAEEQLRRLGLYERYVENGYKLPPEEDCRLTRVGRFLRRSSLDELPQLINVLRGDMSLVGPRPIVPPELSCYGDRADCYLDVRPGLTGLWQITGRSTVTFPERGEIDAEYHTRRSIWFDTKILLRTPMVVLRGTGAY